MQINRLLEIVYILLDKKKVTAKMLSECFEVSQRTIYRDIDVLSSAGIPVYTNKGKGGGISLLDNFVLNKSMLSDKEQVDILSSHHGLNALNISEVEPVLKKLAIIFDKNNTNWIDVDFSSWGSDSIELEKFNILKNSILNQNIVSFEYFGSNCERSERTIEPIRIIFKGQGWYIYGFCRTKNEFRIFKITRIKNLKSSKETFKRRNIEEIWSKPKEENNRTIKIVLRIEEKMAFRMYDEFDQASISKSTDGNFIVTTNLLENEWLYGYLMSYGNSAEILEPMHVREIIKRKFEDGLKKYL